MLSKKVGIDQIQTAAGGIGEKLTVSAGILLRRKTPTPIVAAAVVATFASECTEQSTMQNDVVCDRCRELETICDRLRAVLMEIRTRVGHDSSAIASKALAALVSEPTPLDRSKPCPTCGFHIVRKERPPFVIEDDADVSEKE
jgi:hypothetical protein